jgi:DNA-binding NarL/FixJ family response regulator
MTAVAVLEFLQTLRADREMPPTLVLAETIDKEQLLTTLECGARGIVLEKSTTASLFKSIRCVLKGQYWLGREQVGEVVQSMCCLRSELDARASDNRFGLTHRELQIVSAVSTSASNKAIARCLSLSQETVKRHLTNIFHKLGVFSRVELVVFALNHGIVKDVAARPVSSRKESAGPHDGRLKRTSPRESRLTSKAAEEITHGRLDRVLHTVMGWKECRPFRRDLWQAREIDLAQLRKASERGNAPLRASRPITKGCRGIGR